MPIIRRKTIPKIGNMKARYKIGDVVRAYLTRAHNEKPAVCKITKVADHRGWIRPYEQMYVVDECAEELFSSGCHGIAILENDIVELLKSKQDDKNS